VSRKKKVLVKVSTRPEAKNDCAGREEMEAMLRTSQEHMRTEIKTGQGEMKATVSGIQEKMQAAINSIQSKLDEAFRLQVEDVLASVNQWIWNLCEELIDKIEQTQSGLQAVILSINHRVQVEEQTTKILVETMQHRLETRIADVLQDFAKGLLNIVTCQ
jgi:hypothetical protein